MRESRHRRDRFSDKNSQKEEIFFGSLRFFFKSGPRIPFSVGNFNFHFNNFLAAEKLTLGGGITSKLASVVHRQRRYGDAARARRRESWSLE